jgi:formate dehydrogenase maturation protein FdhE
MALDKTQLQPCPNCEARNTMMYVKQETDENGNRYDVWWCAFCGCEGLVPQEEVPG